MTTHSSMGEAVASAMNTNARRAAETAASRTDGRCGICGQRRDQPTSSDRLCPFHPAPGAIDTQEQT